MSFHQRRKQQMCTLLSETLILYYIRLKKQRKSALHIYINDNTCKIRIKKGKNNT